MSPEDRSRALMDEALRALHSMTPEAMERAERLLGELQAQGGLNDPAALPQLKLLRAAAVNAAALWRGCTPQPGYSPAGPKEEDTGGGSLSVTG